MWRNDTKYKYMFMFPLKKLTRKGLRHWWVNISRMKQWMRLLIHALAPLSASTRGPSSEHMNDFSNEDHWSLNNVSFSRSWCNQLRSQIYPGCKCCSFLVSEWQYSYHFKIKLMIIILLLPQILAEKEPLHSIFELWLTFKLCPGMKDVHFRFEFDMQSANHNSQFSAIGIYGQIRLQIIR